MGNPQVNYSEIIEETNSKHYNVRDEFKNNTVEENREICRQDSLGFAVGALSITGDLNIGIMIRTASLLGADDFYIFGRRQYDKRSTVGAYKYLDVHRIGEISCDAIAQACLEGGYVACFIEQGGCSVRNPANLGRIRTLEYKPMFIFGSESDGIPSDILESFRYRSDVPSQIFSIPQRGVLRSYNVSSAMTIVSWEWSRILMGR